MSIRAAAAFEYSPSAGDQATLERIRQLEARLTRSRLVWMIVSFVHMFSVLYAYTGTGPVNWIATAGQIFAIDYSTMLLAEYVVIRRRFAMQVPWYAWLTTTLLLAASFYLNYISILRGAPDDVAATTTQSLAIILGLTPPLCIIVSALAIASIDETYERAVVHLRGAKATPSRSNFIPSESHNEALGVLDAPDDEAILRSGNGKSDIATSDVEAILAVLAANNVTRLRTTAELGKLCGWTSPSSATKARESLREAGALRDAQGGGFDILYGG